MPQEFRCKNCNSSYILSKEDGLQLITSAENNSTIEDEEFIFYCRNCNILSGFPAKELKDFSILDFNFNINHSPSLKSDNVSL